MALKGAFHHLHLLLTVGIRRGVVASKAGREICMLKPDCREKLENTYTEVV